MKTFQFRNFFTCETAYEIFARVYRVRHSNTLLVRFQASTVQTHLLEIEPEYKANLLNAVEVYKETMTQFVGDYDES